MEARVVEMGERMEMTVEELKRQHEAAVKREAEKNQEMAIALKEA